MIRPPVPQFLVSGLSRFLREQQGSLIIFSLFMIVCMLLAVGVGIDTMRYEVQRTKIQNTLDRAVLAAADLDEKRDPKEVAADYLAREGLPAENVEITITPTIGGKTVSVSAPVKTPTYFLKMIGKPTIEGPAASTAQETVTDVEVVLVLDNSGSMNSNNRINLLKAAAKDFVDTVVKDDVNQGEVSISIVPFATQVNPGDDLASYFNLTTEHTYSSCVTFDDAAFDATALSLTDELVRTANFNPYSNGQTYSDAYAVCPNVASREITLWENDRDALKDAIDDMYAYGWTSIELGTKWGAALLDPAAQPIMADQITQGKADINLTGMPFAYDRPNTKKYLVVMSDGQNTNQWDIKEPYRAGPSPVWMVGDDESTLSYFVADTGQFYHYGTDSFAALPDGANPTNLTWPQVWERFTVRWLARNVMDEALGGTWQSHYLDIVWTANPNFKNTRTSAICGAARDAGITIFTIGMDTYGQGDATLADCAAFPSNFYDVAADDIDLAFASIARTINALRLTQ